MAAPRPAASRAAASWRSIPLLPRSVLAEAFPSAVTTRPRAPLPTSPTSGASKRSPPTTTSAGVLLFGTTSNGGTPAERMRIGSNGMVSIAAGTGNRLTVNGDTKITGNIVVDGNINAKYQDVAEWVPAVELLPAGTVVVLDPSIQSGDVVKRVVAPPPSPASSPIVPESSSAKAAR